MPATAVERPPHPPRSLRVAADLPGAAVPPRDGGAVRGLEAGAEAGNGFALSAGAQEDFRRRLNAAWADALPPPLRELIDAHVAELDIDTYYEPAALNLQLELRHKQRSHPFQLKKDLRRDWQKN